MKTHKRNTNHRIQVYKEAATGRHSLHRTLMKAKGETLYNSLKAVED